MIIRIIILIRINAMINEVLFKVAVISGRLPSSGSLWGRFAVRGPVLGSGSGPTRVHRVS